MLGDILRGQEKSSLVIVEDTCDLPGRHLILSFINSLAQRVEKVVVVTYEKPARYFQESITADLQSRVQIIDCSEDPLGWLRGGSPSIDGDFLKIIEGCLTKGGHKTVAVVIDSLLFHVLHRPPAVTCQRLHAIKTAKLQDAEIVQTVCLLHSDLHDDSTQSLIEHTATSIIKLVQCTSQDFQHSCCIVHQKSTGKVIKMFENFNMDECFNVKEVSEAKPAFTMVKPEVSSQPDPAANLPFNLSLSEREKEARSKVILPYVKTKDGSEGDSQGGGKIFYQPDEADDFDEEDPDDDLDF